MASQYSHKSLVSVVLLGALLCHSGLGVYSQSVNLTHEEHITHDTRGKQKEDRVVRELVKKIAKQQIQKDVPFIAFRQFGEKKGAYPSEVRFNFHGRPESSELRRHLAVADNNMFVTAWVTAQLLEVARVKDGPMPSSEQLSLALNMIASNHDHNRPDNSSLMTFWTQTYNKTSHLYNSMPANLYGFIESTYDLPVDQIVKLLGDLGLKVLESDLEELLRIRSMDLQAFHIPGDFDDTFVNLGLGSLLFRMREKLPQFWHIWSQQNPNILSVFSALKRYAYRPFSKDRNVNTIDTRTYFWIREFLDKSMTSGDLALVSTWTSDIEETRQQRSKGVSMPFNINNVDVTVAANTVYGVTSALLSGMISPVVLDDPEVNQIYLNTTALIQHAIQTNLHHRPDLALMYYPSQPEFFWFVSRTFTELSAAKKSGPLPHKSLDTVLQLLGDAAQNITDWIMERAKSSEDSSGEYFFDDFLGDADLNLFNKSSVRGEDRLFTTSMAVNSLMYLWSQLDDVSGNVSWVEGVSHNVTQVVDGGIAWLKKHILGRKYEPWNAFFSASVKGYHCLPYLYPGNRLEYLNGTSVQNKTEIPHEPHVYGFEGHVEPSVYEKMLRGLQFGRKTPLDFSSYNDEEQFAFWSSPTYTYSTALLAVVRYESIQSSAD